MTTELNDKFTKWAIGLLTTGLIGAFSWAWNLNSEIAVIKSKQLQDKPSIETAEQVLKDWSKMTRDVDALASQMRKMWENYNTAQEKEVRWENRISRIEIKQEICCE